MGQWTTVDTNHTFDKEIRVDEIKDSTGTGSPSFPNGFKTLVAFKTSTTALSGSTDIVFDSVDTNDFTTEYDNTTGIFTVSSPGFYLITATARVNGTITNSRLVLLKNGTEYFRDEENSSSISIASHSLNVGINLAASDTIKFQMQAAGGTTIDGTAFKQNWLNIVKLG